MITAAFNVAGEWRSTDETFDVRSPYDGRLVARVAAPGAADAEDAVVAASGAASAVAALPAHVRMRVLRHVAQRIDERAEALAKLITSESGKPLKAARAEVAKSVTIFEVAAEEVRRWDGEFCPAETSVGAEGRAYLVRRFPRGPVLGITGFNFPLLLAAHKLAPAIATGCPMVLKPALATPVTAFALAEAIVEMDLPPGIISVLPLLPADTQPLVSDDRIKVVSFTGSADVGWALKRLAFDKQFCLEAGGTGPVIVHRDADVGLVGERIALGGFGMAGQQCVAAQRIFVHRAVYDDVVDAVLKNTASLVVGDPADPLTDVGPLITESAAERVVGWIQEAVDAGAELLTGGSREGSVVSPTVLTDVPHDASAWCDEVFGPVVVIEAFDDLDDAIALANATGYGLQAGIFTNDTRSVFHAYRELEVGALVVNDTSAWRDVRMPFGGVKRSGTGREGIRYAMEDMTEPKVLGLSGIPL